MNTWKQILDAGVACGRHFLDLLPDDDGKLLKAAGVAAGAAFPVALVAAGIGDVVLDHVANAPDPGALAKLFRSSLLEALRTCPPDSTSISGATESDLALWRLWEEGFNSHGDSDPGWAGLLDEEVPGEVTRAVSIEVGDECSYWPSLRGLMMRCAQWFAKDAVRVPAPSSYLEQHLAQKLTPAFLHHFLPELTSGSKEGEFREALIGLLRQIGSDLAPLDPLRTVDAAQRPQARKHIDFLVARYRAVPYVGRRDNIEELWGWLNGDEPVSLRVVTGRGGSGKTRFAYEFLEEIERRAPYGWHAGFVDLFEFGELKASRFRRWRGRKPTLIVIDYAASATEILTKQVLPELYNYCLADDRSALRLRFLLLERAAEERQGWYADLLLAARERADELFPAKPMRLADLGPDEQLTLLERMLGVLHRFDRRKGDAVCVPAELAARLKNGPARDPLVLGMAALVAHERAGFGAAFDLDRLDLAREVAKHEVRRIDDLAKATGQSSVLLRHLAAFVTLTGPLTGAELRAAIKAERTQVAPESPREEELFGVVSTRALPPENRTDAADPIVPDIVGEALVVQVLRGAEHQAEETVVRASEVKPGGVTRALRRIIQDFAPAAGRAGDAADAGEDQEWALGLLTGLLRARVRALRDEDFWAIHVELPVASLSMTQAALGFYRAVVDGRPGGLSAESPDLVALTAREWQSVCTAQSGGRAEALGMMGPVVAIRRALADANPDAFLPNLASSLNNQANRQSAMGQRAEALRSIGEAVAIRRKLADANPDAFLPSLAISFGAWGRVLREDEPQLAAEKFGEGLQIIAPFVTALPQAYLRVAAALAQEYRRACEAAGIDIDESVVPALETIAAFINEGAGEGESPPEKATGAGE